VSPRPDLEIEGEVRARKLRFRSRPRLVTPGDAGSERERLPERVQARRTYREPRIRAWLHGWLVRHEPSDR
jgi:hypothetical protein